MFIVLLIATIFKINSKTDQNIATIYSQIQLPKSPLILFDFDGVICNSYEHVIDIYNSLHSLHKFKKINKSSIPEYRDLDTKQLIQSLAIQKIKLLRLIPTILKMFESKITQMTPFPCITELLNVLSENGYILGIVTANSKKNVHAFLEKHNLNCFKFISSSKNTFIKHLEFNRLIKDSNICPSKIVYICDEPSDIKACKKSNITSIAVSWGYYSHKVLSRYNPDHLINTPEEITNIVSSF